VVLMAAGPNAVLVTVTSGAAKIGLVLFEMRRAAARIVEIIDEPAQVAMQGTSDGQAAPEARFEDGDSPAPPPFIPQTPPSSEPTFSTWH
jgi:hypothetical protein